MKTRFYQVELTISKSTKEFKSQTITWNFLNRDNAEQQYLKLKEHCENYDDIAKNWKYLHVKLNTIEFDD